MNKIINSKAELIGRKCLSWLFLSGVVACGYAPQSDVSLKPSQIGIFAVENLAARLNTAHDVARAATLFDFSNAGPALLRADKNGPLTTTTKLFTAATPGLSSDLEIIVDQIDRAIATGSGDILLEPRTYRLACESLPHKYCFNINGARNLRIRGVPGQTRLLVTTPRSGVAMVNQSQGITFQDLIIDYETPPFAQGVVVSVNNSNASFVLQTSAGYSLPTDPLLTTDLFTGPTTLAIGIVMDPNRLYLKSSPADWVGFGSNIEALGNGQWRIYTNRSPLGNYMAPGDRFAYGPRTSSGLFFYNSSEIAVKNVTLYTAPSLGFAFVGNTGHINLDRVTITQNPNSDRILSTVADAFHFQNNAASIVLKDSIIQGMGDDLWNTYAIGVKVRETGGNLIRIEQPNAPGMRVGDRIQILDSTKKTMRFEATILEVSIEPGAVLLTIDRDTQGLVGGDLVFNVNLAAPGAIVTRNHFGPFRGQVRLRSANSKFVGNAFDDWRNAKMLISIDTGWNEGPMVSAPYAYGNWVAGGSLQFFGLDFSPAGVAPLELYPPVSAANLPTFDWRYYVRTNSDLGNMSEVAATTHWRQHGISEGRQGSPYFSAREYVSMYSDLRDAYGTDYVALLNHFEHNGIGEGRAGRIGLHRLIFSPAYYRKQNPDLQGMSDADLISHWLENGIFESREGSTEFSALEYLQMNSDLGSANPNSYISAMLHYITNGAAEGRSTRYAFSPGIFDLRYYLDRNPDLDWMDNMLARAHWFESGVAEGRVAAPSYSGPIYLNRYPDLQPIYSQFGYPGVLKHWVLSGKFEGRMPN